MSKFKVTTTELQLYAFSIPGHDLPTFSKGRLKTVRNKWGCIVTRYVCFTEISHHILYPKSDAMYWWQKWNLANERIYKSNYIRVK